jgi:hypothetical protein
MTRRTALLLALLPSAALAQEWSGASLRGAPALRLPFGYTAEVVGVGFRLPQDLAVESAAAVWLLSQVDRAGGAGSLVRVPLDGAAPVEAATLPAVSIPFGPGPARFRVGSLARHPTTGDLYVAEQSGRHLFRVSPAGDVVLYARGLERLAETRAVAFDGAGRLIVLDLTGPPVVGEAGAADLRALFGGADAGPVLYRLRVDEPVQLPRNLEAFAPFLRSRPGGRSRYVGVLALSSDLALGGWTALIDRLRPDGSVVPLTRTPAARVAAAGPQGDLYALDSLGGRLVRIRPDGAVEEFVHGLVRPTAVAVLPDGSLIVAGDTGRILRLRAGAE